MVVAVTTDHRFFRTQDGAIWTDSINSYDFWTRYLSVFERVKIVARVLDVPRPGSSYRRADGPGVCFSPLPNYSGPWQYLSKATEIYRKIRKAVDRSDAVILRVSSPLAGYLQPALVRTGRPYGLEVVNDPADVFAPGAVRYRLRPLLRWWLTGQLRRQCRAASAVAYVTERALQQRYPGEGLTLGLSDVQISEASLLRIDAGARAYARRAGPGGKDVPFRLITVSSLAQMYKAPDVLIRAVADCVEKGWKVALYIVGDGRYRTELEGLARSLGAAGAVHFVGQLPPGEAVRNQLDRADLFILPSRCEGLPRALVEAMARSLPCIGSAVGGIPELLAPEDLVQPGDCSGLSARIREVLGSPARMSAMSARNFIKAQEYLDGALAERRRAFLDHIRRATEEWITRERLTPAPETAEIVSGG
jgi:glycosyltransferase involved in cell wall biosynthesis